MAHLFRPSVKKIHDESTTHTLTWQLPVHCGAPPSVRNGHTADVINSKIYYFGGGDKADLLADLHVFDVAESAWTLPPCTGLAPPPRSRHCSAVFDRQLYIWGGIGGGVDVHVLDTVAMDWSTPNVYGTEPDSRFGHTCAAVDVGSMPRLIVLGGHDSRQALSDVHVLDMAAAGGESGSAGDKGRGVLAGNEMHWLRPSVHGEPPICGNRHATVLLDDHQHHLAACLLVFAADMHDTFGTLYALRFRDGLQANGYRWLPVTTRGKPPLSRARPSLCMLDKHVFLVCGVAAGKPLATVAMLDTHNNTWSAPSIDGMPPPSRMGATCSRVGTDLYIFGGSDGKASLRDLNVLVYVTWFTPAYGGRQPPSRVGHTATFLQSKFYLLGGAHHGRATNDLYVLDPASQQWARPPMYGTPPDALVGHSTVGAGNELIVWGGGDGRRSHSGLNVVDTANMLWSRPNAAGAEPLAHVGHSAVNTGAKMFVFGGYGQKLYWNELVVLDTGIMVWIRPHTSGAPPQPCVCHSATLTTSHSGRLMVVYGGAYDETPIDQLVALDISTMLWSNIGNLVWDGDRPESRFGHGAAAIGPKIFIFGGTTGSVPDTWRSYLQGGGFVTGYAGGARNDLNVIDLQERKFSQPRYGGMRPLPVYRVAAASYRGKLFLYGGVGSDGAVVLLDTGLHEPSLTTLRGEGTTSTDNMLASATAVFYATDAHAAAAAGDKLGYGGIDKRQDMPKGLDAGEAAELIALLQDLGLNKYARMFLRQEVDTDSLLQLSDRDLKDMGLVAIGARRKLTAAIHQHRLQRQGGTGEERQVAADASAAAAVAGNAAGTGDADALMSGHAVAGEFFRGRYKLTGKTYLGGSARVVCGDDIKTGVPVAVKVHLSRACFSREVKLLKHLHSEFVVQLYDAFEDEDLPPTLVLEGGSHSLAEYLREHQLTHIERKLVLERMCLALDFVHSKSLVLVDLKPQNVVIFGSLLGLKLIDLECLRKVGENIPFKLTPFYAAPELAAAALETMRLGELPALEYRPRTASADGASAEGDEGEEGGGADLWGGNLQKIGMLSDNLTLARRVAATSQVASYAGDGSQELNRDAIKQLEAPLKQANGKLLRAQPTMDLWALGMIAYELFVNEPYFAGCSDDVALQVLATPTPLHLPAPRIAEPQAEHLLSKILHKRPKERLPLESILRHAFLVGGLDTHQVGESFAMLHKSQQEFKDGLADLQGAALSGGLHAPDEDAGVLFKDSFKEAVGNPPPGGVPMRGAYGGRQASFAPDPRGSPSGA